MRIAIDARELAGKPTGVGRYLSEILSTWGDLPAASAHEFILCAPELHDVPAMGPLRASTRTAPGKGALWEQWVLPRLVAASKADVLFAPAYSGPVRRSAPMVVTIHDVSFAAHPEWFSWGEGLRRRTLTRMSARRAAKIITVSDFSKREIARHLGVDPAAIEVIYSGATSLDQRTGRRASGNPSLTGASSREADGGVVLYVGSLFNRRHIPALIDGFARVARRHPAARLEIVGDNRTRPYIDVETLIAGSGAADRIRARAYIPDDILSTLYATASAFAFLSEYEGFGMTPLDALAAGMPIVVLDTEVAREIYGPAAIYVGRPDPVLIERAIERALFDGAERARLADLAMRQLARYSWRECAQRTLQVLLACA
jgi:glycosyltransferase involved in cell wall biosynthesis